VSLASITNMPKVKRKAVAATKTPAKSKSSSRTKAKSKVEADQKIKVTASAARIAKSKTVFFCDPDDSEEGGFLSPWWESEFEVKDVVYTKAGQYILAEKARAFGDKVGSCESYIHIDMMTQDA
jgi:predicted NAD-dependent protein-ADP-ribosyltransferase YbiA (DUF1768 family)